MSALNQRERETTGKSNGMQPNINPIESAGQQHSTYSSNFSQAFKDKFSPDIPTTQGSIEILKVNLGKGHFENKFNIFRTLIKGPPDMCQRAISKTFGVGCLSQK